MTEDEMGVLESTIDSICQSVGFLDTFPSSQRSTLIQFSVEFCDNYGVSKDSVEVVLKAEMTQDQKRELFIEVNGLVTETIVYESGSAINRAATSAIVTGILEFGGALSPAGWFMAVATGGAYLCTWGSGRQCHL